MCDRVVELRESNRVVRAPNGETGDDGRRFVVSEPVQQGGEDR